MRNAVTSTARLREAEERIAWIDAHPAFSSWLKETLRNAVGRDPVAVLNDLEILGHLLRGWASASIDMQGAVAHSPLRDE
jgi:hypothetical protein